MNYYGSFWKVVLFKKHWRLFLPEKMLDKSLVQKIYNELAETTQYQEYIAVEGREKGKEKEIIKLYFHTFNVTQ